MTGRLRVDTDLLSRAGTTLTAIRADLQDVGSVGCAGDALGHDALADTVDVFAHGWDDARRSVVRLVGELGDATGTVDAGDGSLGPVLRTVTERGARTGGTGPDGTGGDTVTDDPATDLLVCDYWSDPDDGDGLLVLPFSTPLLPLRDTLLALFDVIAGSAHRDGTVDDGTARERASPTDIPHHETP